MGQKSKTEIFTLDNDPETDYAKPIPARTYRILQHNIPLLSSNDRAPQLHLDDDHMTVMGEKGYAMVRGTHGVRADYWGDRHYYYEGRIFISSKKDFVRIIHANHLWALRKVGPLSNF